MGYNICCCWLLLLLHCACLVVLSRTILCYCYLPFVGGPCINWYHFKKWSISKRIVPIQTFDIFVCTDFSSLPFHNFAFTATIVTRTTHVDVLIFFIFILPHLFAFDSMSNEYFAYFWILGKSAHTIDGMCVYLHQQDRNPHFIFWFCRWMIERKSIISDFKCSSVFSIHVLRLLFIIICHFTCMGYVPNYAIRAIQESKNTLR